MKQMKTESIVKQSLVAFALAGLTFGVVACGDDSSSSAPAEEPAVKTSLTGVVFGSDYTTGELRWIDKDGKISDAEKEAIKAEFGKCGPRRPHGPRHGKCCGPKCQK